MTFADAKQRFPGRVADDARYGPGYRSDGLAWKVAANRILPSPTSPRAPVVCSEPVRKNRSRGYSVAPNNAGRQDGEEYFVAYDNYSTMVGLAEATTLVAGSTPACHGRIESQG